MNLTEFIQKQAKINQRPRLKRDFLIENWEAVGKAFSPKYKLDDLAEKYINYFCSERELYYPQLADYPLKGLYVYGDIGMGKTLGFNIYKQILRITRTHLEESAKRNECHEMFRSDRYFHIEDMKDMEIQYKKSKGTHLEVLAGKGELVIDDIGTEAVNNKDFGTDVDLVSDILRLRYNKLKMGPYITHITTNLDRDTFISRYGNRIWDRLNEMMIPIYVKGQSKRI